MNRSWPIWLILIVCALSILGALGWQTQRTLSMERDRLEANARAKVEERVRLALSRMDTVASAMLVIENQRPPEFYQPFYQPKVLFTNALQKVDGDLVTEPSPLLSDPPEFIKLHFEVWAHRDLTSPQVPTGNHRDLAEASGISREVIEASTERLVSLYKLLNKPVTIGELNADPGQAMQEASLGGAACDNYDLMVQVAQNGNSWNETPAHVPFLSEDWSNRQLNEIVSNSYTQAEAQTSYQQDLNMSVRYKRQQAIEQAQTRAAKGAVYSTSLSKKAEGERRDVEKLKDDAIEEKEVNQPLLVNPKSSSYWANGSSLIQMPGAAPQQTPAPNVAEEMVQADQGGRIEFQRDGKLPAGLVLEDLIGDVENDAQADADSGDIVDIEVTPFRPLWLDDELLVVRRVRSENGMRFQGFWIDAEALRASLVQDISDLLPNARLLPIAGYETTSLENGFDKENQVVDDRSLVTLPWRLEEGIEVDVEMAGFTPLHTSLGIGWVAVLLAMVAAAMLVRGVLRMSERRAAFVSSVTHELRTPLTTFQLYSDLLAEGMVPEGEKRQSYLKTMRLEAGRLNHLIENVLSYSRIERGSARARREKLSVASLIGRFEDRLAARAQRDHARFEVKGLGEIGGAEVDTDVTAVEQIIFNLVDNACKYGLPAEGQGMIRLHLEADRKWVRLSVCDTGNGIRRGDHRKLFRPFHKSAHDAAETKPGVGLGLALCRRLAKALGGQLTVDSKRNQGACFELKLPKAQD